MPLSRAARVFKIEFVHRVVERRYFIGRNDRGPINSRAYEYTDE